MSAQITLSMVIMRMKMLGMMPLDKYFGGISNARFYNTREIKWQIVDIENTPASFHPLTQKAKIIGKDGHSYLQMTPPSLNEGIVRESYSEMGLKAGELAEIRPDMASGLDQEAYEQLETAKVLVRRYKTRLLVGAGQALSLGGIQKNDDGDFIYYAIPASQKHAIDWSLAATSRITDLDEMVTAARANNETPREFVFGATAFASFVSGDDVREGTTDAGKGINFRYADVTSEETESGYYRIGQVRLATGWYDIFVWDDTYTDELGTSQYYFDKDAITLTSRNCGGMAYGAINYGNDAMKKVEWRAAEFFAKEGEKTGGSDDNPEYKDIFRSAPACIVGDGKKLSIGTVTSA